jgi:hypothetical protein
MIIIDSQVHAYEANSDIRGAGAGRFCLNDCQLCGQPGKYAAYA